MEGFDLGDYAIKGWTAVDSLPSAPGVFSLPTGRVGGKGLSIATATNGSSGQTLSARKLFTASAQATVGVAVSPTAYSTGGNGGGFAITLSGDAGATSHLTLMSNATTRALELRRGNTSGTLIATSTIVIPIASWAYIEIQATIADAGGTCVVRLNGSTTPAINFTGDTKNAGTATTIDSITLLAYRPATQGGISSAIFDDLYVLNSTGTANTTFLGDIRVQSLLPSGNGTASQLVGSDSDQVDNYQLVDENPYSTTDYTASATVGNRDTYAMDDLPGSITQITAVQTNLVAAKSDATAATARIPLRSGGTEYYGTNYPLATTYATYHDPYDLNPATSAAWTAAAVNGLETGMEVA